MGNKVQSMNSVDKSVYSSVQISKVSSKVPEPKFGNVSKSEATYNSKTSESEEPDDFYVSPTEESFTKVALIGSEGVGKSSIITQYVEEKFVVYNSAAPQGSLRFFNRNEAICDEMKRLKIYDLIGNEEWSKIKFYLGSLEGLMVVFDLTDTKSFEHAKHLCKLVKKEISEMNKNPTHFEVGLYDNDEVESKVEEQVKQEQLDLFSLGILLLGNKSDDVASRKVDKEEVVSFSNGLGIDYVECSAKENINIKKVFIDVLEQNSPYPL